MIYMDNFEKFHSIISDLKASGAQVYLYGKTDERYSGAFGGFETPPNNTFTIRIVALTSVGTIYCNSNTKLKDNVELDTVKQLYQQLSVSEAEVSYVKDSGNIKIQ